eukprot:CAMPEP_0197021228 /NCGR_PEP_ID=MMETSP1384-20130603/2129_1 /TAXON_ID=29189 /ORGANISM="Ammonia sp." /LENGTH=154 /DNA_ID=CAMNT_0042449009 /DNA_START=76 /DNA_END=536 /DNA_ORIENTATION=+
MAEQKAESVVEWKSKEEVDHWFNGVVMPAFKAWLEGEPGKEPCLKVVKAVNSCEHFKMFVLNNVMDRESWIQFGIPMPAVYKTVQRCYDVELWHPRFALVSFVYFDTFVDGTTMIAKGKASIIRTEKGEVEQWVYYSKDGSLEALFGKTGELLA